MIDWFKELHRDWNNHDVATRTLLGALAIALCIAVAVILAGMVSLVA